MRLIDALSRLKKPRQPVLRTADVMALLDVNTQHASKLLSRLASSGHVARLKRGLWLIDERLCPMALSGYIVAPCPGYVSLQTALYNHGMISQIPKVTYVVSTARTRVYKTPVGAFSIHHLNPAFLFGFGPVGRDRIPMAKPEKALLDFLYLSPARSRLFAALPELELPGTFSAATARRMIRRVPSKNRRRLLRKRFEQVMETAAR